jgi:hypothetical protein
MDPLNQLESRPFNRRIFIAGGASVVLTKGLFGHIASASAAVGTDTEPWTAGVIQTSPSGGSLALAEMPFDMHRQVQVALTPTTTVTADLNAGNSVVVQGTSAGSSEAITADRVIRLVVGSESQLATSR